MIGTDAFQETPIVEVTRQITKHNYLVMDIADLPRVMKEVKPVCCLNHPHIAMPNDLSLVLQSLADGVVAVDQTHPEILSACV